MASSCKSKESITKETDNKWASKLEKSARTKCKNYKEINDGVDNRIDLVDQQDKELKTDWQCKMSCVRDRIQILFNRKNLSDVTFIVGKKPDIRTFYAHKFILSISSPVFEAWFNHSGWLNENRTTNDDENEITLIDEEPEAFKNLLKFIYSDEVNAINASNVLDTLYTAKKYCVTYLEKACINFLETCLDTESAFFLLTKVG